MGIDEKETYEERLYDLTKRYTVNDITRLMESEIQAAGLLVMPAFAGMIALGHFMYGFELSDRAGFLKFARYRMKIDKGLAEILYDNAYSGLVREWVSKSRIILCAWYNDPEEIRAISHPREDGKKGLEIDAITLARVYIEAVSKLPTYGKTKRYKFAINNEELKSLRDQIDGFLRSKGVSV